MFVAGDFSFYGRFCSEWRSRFVAGFSILALLAIFEGNVLGQTVSPDLISGKSLAMQGRTAEAEVYLRKAAASKNKQTRAIAAFWLDYIKAKAWPLEMLYFRTWNEVRKIKRGRDDAVKLAERFLTTQPYSPDAHLMLGESYAWLGEGFYHSTRRPLSIGYHGAPYAMLREAAMAFAVAKTWNQTLEALFLEQRAREALFLTFQADYERCLDKHPCCRQNLNLDNACFGRCCDPKPYLEGMEIQAAKISAIDKDIAATREHLAQNGYPEVYTRPVFLPMEPLLRDDSFLILAPVAE